MNGSDDPRWRKSTFSGANGGGCIEVADHDGMIMVRDTKNHGRGPVHQYTPGEWRAFIAGVRNGQFDLDESGHLPWPVVTRIVGEWRIPARRRG